MAVTVQWALLCFPAADSTGTHSLYTTYKDYEIMFHVSTLLPYTPNNKQQVKMESPATVVYQQLCIRKWKLLCSETNVRKNSLKEGCFI